MKRQRGVALLTALVLLALATMLATGIAFDSAMVARRSTATLGMEQALALAQGAEALAAYALKQDNNKKQDDPSEPWAQPYGPIPVEEDVSLEAQMFDEQGKFNLNTLLNSDGNPDDDSVLVFKRLLQLLQIETNWAMLLVDWLDVDGTPDSAGGEDSLYSSQAPPGRAANLPVTSVSELEQLPGFGRERYLRLLPHVTALPASVRAVNVCTATGPVLDSIFALSEKDANNEEFSRMPPEELAKARTSGCFPRVATTFAGEDKFSGRVGETTSFFQLRTWVRIGPARFALYSLMYRNPSDPNGQARPIVRTFGTE